MSNSIHAFVFVLILSTGTAFAGAGAPPTKPIDPPETGAELKHACGQNVEGFSERVSEPVLRAMLVTECRAIVKTVVELVNNGQLSVDGAPAWKCVKDRENHDALAAQFVKWVGRRPVLLRQPAQTAFVEAIEMSEKCRN